MARLDEFNNSIKHMKNKEVSQTMNKAVNSEQFRVTGTAKHEDTRSGEFGTIFCPNCSGSGKYFYVDRGVSRCNFCGGSGLIKLDKNRMADKEEMPQLIS
jgi:hypothetical protein